MCLPRGGRGGARREGFTSQSFPGLAVSLVFWGQWLGACRWLFSGTGDRGRGGGDGQVLLASVTIRVGEMDRDLFL